MMTNRLLRSGFERLPQYVKEARHASTTLRALIVLLQIADHSRAYIYAIDQQRSCPSLLIIVRSAHLELA